MLSEAVINNIVAGIAQKSVIFIQSCEFFLTDSISPLAMPPAINGRILTERVAIMPKGR